MAVSGDILGTAYVQIQALTDKFGADATAKVKAGLSGVEKQAATSGQKAGAALDSGVSGGAGKARKSLLSMFSNTGAFAPLTDLIGDFSSKMDALGEHAKTSSKALIGIGAAATGVGGLLQAAASKDQAAAGQLKASIEAVGGSWDDYEGRVDKAIKSGEKFGITADKTDDALATLTQATHDPEKALDRLQLVTDLAARKHVDLNSAATMVARAMGGNERVFKQFGITVGTAADGTKDIGGALDKLTAQLSGQANAQAATFTGHLQSWKAKAEDFVAEVGGKVGPALTTLGPILLGVGALAESGLLGKLKQIPGGVSSAFSKMGSLISNPYVAGAAVAVTAIAGIGAAVYAHEQQVAHAKEVIQAWADSLTTAINPSTFTSIAALDVAFLKQNQTLDDAKAKLHTAGGAYDFMAQQMKSGADIIQVIQHGVAQGTDDVTAAEAKNAQQKKDVIGLLDQLGAKYGKSRDDVLAYAAANGIDLTKSLADVTAQFGAVGTAVLALTPQEAALSAATKTLTTDSADATAASSALQVVLDGMVNSPLAVAESTDAFSKSLLGMVTAAAQGGHTQADLAGAMYSSVHALEASAEATYKQVYATQGQDAAAQAAAAVLASGKVQIDNYAAANGVAADKVGAVNTELAGAISQLKGVTANTDLAVAALNKIPSQKDIIIHYAVTGSIPTGGKVTGFASGGLVTAQGGPPPGPSDTVATLLTPGEFVVRPDGSNLAAALAHYTKPSSSAASGPGMGNLARLLAEQNAILRALLPAVGPSVAQSLNGMSTRANYQRNGRVYP